MNCLKNISTIVLVALNLTNTTLFAEFSYQNIIKQYAQEWTNTYIDNNSSTETQTITDLLFLSYRIIAESSKMIIAKFTIQRELFKIYTPSFIDSWHENLQFHENDTKKLEESLSIIKESQVTLENIYEQFQKLIPCIIKTNPKPTQTLIVDLKNSLLAWGKDQKLLIDQLSGIQQEFSFALSTISDIKDLFETVSQTHEVKHAHLKGAASFYAKTYKDFDTATDHFVSIRIMGILKIQQFFECFFKTYYTTMCNKLQLEHDKVLFI